MLFEQVELRGASIITKADIGKGRSSVIVGLDAPLTSEAAAALNAAGKLALPYIVQRNDHQNALCAGFGVTEFAPEGKAALEILALWRWIWQGAWMNQNKPSTTRPAAPRDQLPGASPLV